MVVEERLNEKFSLIKEYIRVVNGSCIINHVHTLLYVIHCNMLTLKNLLTLYFLTPITKIHMVFISNRYLIFHYGLIILGHELKGVQLNGELKRVNVDPLVYLIILVIIEKQFKMDSVKENFCFKLRFLFHISILSSFFYPFILYPLTFLHDYISWCELGEVDLFQDVVVYERTSSHYVQV